jgi:kynurenine 3-monooxygenase
MKNFATFERRIAAFLCCGGICCCLLLSIPNSCFAFLAHPSSKSIISFRSHHDLDYSVTQILSSSYSLGESDKLSGLKVAIAGAGPSGLLLAHLLLRQGAIVSIYESRPDPRSRTKAALAGFAYALGLGIRGRRAIKSVDERLWASVKKRANACDRFRLHVGPFNFKLRDSEKTRRKKSKKGGQELDDSSEPSLLLFQADLCIAMIEELERRYSDDGNLNMFFQSRVLECNLDKQVITVDMNKNLTISERYDILVGCDGVNSRVRSAIKGVAPKFAADKQTLPGEFKVARLNTTPPKLDPNSVALIIPKQGSSTAFMEPTVNGSCCILFAGRGGPDNPILSPNLDKNKTAALKQTLLESFPLLEGADLEEIAEQLITQKPGTASSVVCNAYHYESSAAIAGDAAHATGKFLSTPVQSMFSDYRKTVSHYPPLIAHPGGVSGQGVNSALLDSVALTDCLLQHFDPSNKDRSLETCLLSYSKRQVPEGKALYDLSFGPKPTGFKKVVFLLRGIRDTILGGRFGIGKPPLQTLLTTSMEPFASIRRKMDYFYETPFPDAAYFNNSVSAVYASQQMVDELKRIKR